MKLSFRVEDNDGLWAFQVEVTDHRIGASPAQTRRFPVPRLGYVRLTFVPRASLRTSDIVNIAFEGVLLLRLE